MHNALHKTIAKTNNSRNSFVDTVNELVETNETPFYLFDENVIRTKITKLKEVYSDFKGVSTIAFSMKSNFNPAIMKILNSEKVMFDLATLGELYFAKKSGINPSNMIYTSISEELSEYKEILESGINLVVVSSYNGYLNLENAASSCSKKLKVMIRINPEINVEAEIKASYKYGKFGLPLDEYELDSAPKILNKILESKNLEFEGFHFHLGSQITNPDCFVRALEKIEDLITEIRKKNNDFTVNTIDIGGGTPVKYSKEVPTPEKISEIILKKINSMVEEYGMPKRMIIESGRYIVAESGTLISKVVNVKFREERKFIFVDSGFHLLLDSALVKQEYPIEIISEENNQNDKNITVIAGILCDTDDTFSASNDSDLSNATKDTIVIFKNAGAYSTVFNMPFHCQIKPSIFLKKINGETIIIREKQNNKDLFEEEGGLLIQDDIK